MAYLGTIIGGCNKMGKYTYYTTKLLQLQAKNRKATEFIAKLHR